MLCLNGRPYIGLFFISLTSLVLQSAVVILLSPICEGQTSVTGPSSHIVVMVGEDVVLPCSLQPAVDAAALIVEWGRQDLSPRFVHVWHEGQDLLTNQNPSYRGRTSLSTDRLKRGDASLSLSKVTLSDNGTYRCLFPTHSLESTVELVVGAATLPVIAGVSIDAGGSVVLECECSGWYPEPEVSWMDAGGHLVSAGPADTVRGPDDLYTVSSRVTVDQSHGSTVTCRVHQDRTNQTRQTHIYISAEHSSHSSAARVAVLLVVFFISIIAVVFIVWKWQQTRTNTDVLMHPEDKGDLAEQRQQLMVQSRSVEERRMALDEQRRQEHMKTVQVLEKLKKEMDEWMSQLKKQRDDTEAKRNEIEKKLQNVEKETENNRAEGFFTIKGILNEAKSHLGKREEEDCELIQKLQTLVVETERTMDEMTPKHD